MFQSRSLFATVVAFLPFALSIAACSAEQTGALSPDPNGAEGAPAKPGSPTTKSGTGASFCAAYCGKLNTCDNTRDSDTCENSCENRNAATLPKLRGEIVTSLASCIEAKDCSTVLSKDVIGTCAAEAAAETAPSAAAVKFCDALAKTSTKCNSTSDRAQCLSSAKLYNDAALADALSCTQKACSDVTACVGAALATLSTSTPTAAPSQPAGSCSAVGDGKLFDTGSSTCDSCLGSSCCTLATSCASDSSCSSLWRCVATCDSSDSCISACASRYPNGVDKLNAALTCADARCSSACE